MMWTLALIPYIIAPNGRKLSSGESATKSNIQELFINIFRVRKSNLKYLLSLDQSLSFL